MHRLLILALGLAFASCSHAATVTASPETLASVISRAHDGDTISLAPGAYDSLRITKHAFAKPLTIESADPAHHAVVSSIYMLQVTGVIVRDLNVETVATPQLSSGSNAVSVIGSHEIQLLGIKVHGANSIWGIDPNSDPSTPRPGDAIMGWPNGRGIYVYQSDHVTVSGGEVASFLKGITLSTSSFVTVDGLDIHNIRTSPINGGNLNSVKVSKNYIHELTPWHGVGGKGSAGDHSDGIHFFTVHSTAPVDGLTISNNRLVLSSAPGSLGINIEGSPAPAGFTNLVIDGNQVAWNNNQGITAHYVFSGEIKDNELKPAPGLTRVNDAPAIVVDHISPEVAVTGNSAKCNPILAAYPGNSCLTPAQLAKFITSPGSASPSKP